MDRDIDRLIKELEEDTSKFSLSDLMWRNAFLTTLAYGARSEQDKLQQLQKKLDYIKEVVVETCDPNTIMVPKDTNLNGSVSRKE